ncbi:sulfatase-like hydrolase/transferase [Bradyrhizobium sp. CSA207]|uniref:sulfatase-like hydrolase/transferase n=1 Tax=Bradyrhizobium sp. CSA207 TaxID=2698826 RepID=UPI0023AFA631|nr:sulfatase-like hydrolase/transferase [Bradyrhizobium sp. CSA207]MDE5445811.1 sulfatase-like hydrolase/transferase [Bradyrhizobium sp. CSA207]
MREVKNILFIMFDQLRFDYLSCSGHPSLKTPNIDQLAARGVRFTRAYAQSPICGSSRMSFYTGRYVHSHGAQRNNFPLKIGEQTLGDHLRAGGVDAYLVGKTHMEVDAAGLLRLGIAPDSIIGARIAECGFDIVVRDDGLCAEGPDGFYDERRSPYNEYLKSRGYPSFNPWHAHANAGIDENKDIASGWLMKNADKPANIREEDSETPWLTTEGIKFLEQHRKRDKPWLCHLSYIKPHWPYIVPSPYHALYGTHQILPAMRHERERLGAHPIYEAFMQGQISRTFSRNDVRSKVIPAYMGLIKQCDDQMGRLLAYLEEAGLMDNTLIVITSDHGDYLGDHWLGEKGLFHDCSVKIPLIIYDPSPFADGTRGTTCDELVEAIDLAPTFLEAVGAEVPAHILEGRSLLPFLRGEKPASWREFAVSEYDYSTSPPASKLGLPLRDCRLFMVVDRKWKFWHFEGGYRPLLFDLENDPEELDDLGASEAYASVIEEMYERLGRWARRLSQRTAISDIEVLAQRGGAIRKGILLGLYDGTEVPKELLSRIHGRSAARFVGPDTGPGYRTEPESAQPEPAAPRT